MQLEPFPDPNKTTLEIQFFRDRESNLRERPLITAKIIGSWFIGNGFTKETAAKAAIANLKRAKGIK